MSKKILILSPFHSPNQGGAETFLDALENEAKKWFNITVLTYQPFKGQANAYEEHYYRKGSIKIYRMNWWLKPLGAWKGTSLLNALSVIPKMALKSLWLCLKNKYDIIHAQGLLSGFVAVLLKRVFKVKVFITLLALYDFDTKSKWFQNICKWILNSCDLIFVEGENGKKDIEAIVGNVELRVFSHWCDQTIFRPPHNRNSSRIRVLFIGRPIPEKGRHIVEGAERILNNRKFEFTYVEDAKTKELPEIYKNADIVVVPSLYSEGYSRVVAEAASCGCALIVSNNGSLPEMVYGWGLAIDPTVENFSREIAAMEFRKDLFQRLSLEHAQKNFSVKNSEVILESYSSN